jgi:methylglyoxal/glyoxal reductase
MLSRALHNGVQMPSLGFGVYQCKPGRETEQIVNWGIEVGYRLIDTARYYGNERDVGKAVKASGLPREELFITTKLHPSDLGYDSTLRAFDTSLRELGLDYIDLYLIHWPLKSSRFYKPGLSKALLDQLDWPARMRLKTWKAMERIVAGGKCRAIGVSNYTMRHLQEILSASNVKPTVNQVEFTPFCNQRELLRFCRAQSIQMEAYSPLARGNRFSDSTLRRIAAKYERSTAQILIRWALEHQVVVIPKASNLRHLRENFEVFDFSISSEDMASLNGLNEDLHFSWDPTDLP